jgi:hypothetical protein
MKIFDNPDWNKIDYNNFLELISDIELNKKENKLKILKLFKLLNNSTLEKINKGSNVLITIIYTKEIIKYILKI